jgi:fructuronate reductase
MDAGKGLSVKRLSLATLDRIAPAVRPQYDPAQVGAGIVHLGLGAFSRAHLAVYTDDVLAADGGAWGVCGVSQRTSAVPDQLGPQDGLYSVLERGDHTGIRVIGSVRETLFAGADPAVLTARLADPNTHIISLTVTEKGYRHDPGSGRLRAGDPQLRADAEGRPPRTVVGRVVAGLAARRANGAGGITVLCCDNLPHNGRVVRGLVTEFAAWRDARVGGDLADWVDRHVTFPSTMVDRIVPATRRSDCDDASRLLGVADAGTVVAEPFRQWVIEDTFAAGRPRWEHAGAIMTDDVTAYEVLKLRLLNGAHSALAYLGALAGHDFIWQAATDPVLAVVADRLMAEDAAPTVMAPGGTDIAAYRDQVLTRFANPAIGHRVDQVAMDGSQKLPQRLLDTARARLAAGAEPTWVCLAVAGWMRYVMACGPDLDDPMAAELTAAVGGVDDPRQVAHALLRIESVFGSDLAASPVFAERVVDWLAQLVSRGAARTLRAAVAHVA